MSGIFVSLYTIGAKYSEKKPLSASLLVSGFTHLIGKRNALIAIPDVPMRYL
jgi:hypothetical protein